VVATGHHVRDEPLGQHVDTPDLLEELRQLEFAILGHPAPGQGTATVSSSFWITCSDVIPSASAS
jgi:hypothetical protein